MRLKGMHVRSLQNLLPRSIKHNEVLACQGWHHVGVYRMLYRMLYCMLYCMFYRMLNRMLSGPGAA